MNTRDIVVDEVKKRKKCYGRLTTKLDKVHRFVAVAVRLTEFIVLVKTRDFTGRTISDNDMNDIIYSRNVTNFLSLYIDLVGWFSHS